MSITLSFTGETHEHAVAEMAHYMSALEVVATPEKEEPKSTRRGAKTEEPGELMPEAKKPARRGRPPKKEEGDGKKPTRKGAGSSRRGRPKAEKKKEGDISPLLMDTLKAAHQVTEEIEEGEDLVKTIMKEEFDKENMSDLTNLQLEKLTEILKEELEFEPEED